MKLTTQTLRGFTELMASDAPAPGGGSAAALSASMGASLGCMVAALTVGKEKYAEHQELVSTTIERLTPIAKELLLAVDRDTEAFNEVSAVFVCPSPLMKKRQYVKRQCKVHLKMLLMCL